MILDDVSLQARGRRAGGRRAAGSARRVLGGGRRRAAQGSGLSQGLALASVP